MFNNAPDFPDDEMSRCLPWAAMGWDRPVLGVWGWGFHVFLLDGACGFGDVQWHFRDSVSWGGSAVPAPGAMGSGYRAACHLPLGQGPQRGPRQGSSRPGLRRDGLLSSAMALSDPSLPPSVPSTCHLSSIICQPPLPLSCPGPRESGSLPLGVPVASPPRVLLSWLPRAGGPRTPASLRCPL